MPKMHINKPLWVGSKALCLELQLTIYYLVALTILILTSSLSDVGSDSRRCLFLAVGYANLKKKQAFYLCGIGLKGIAVAGLQTTNSRAQRAVYRRFK
jgi:hypothetical protein